jgi:UDP-N-acetyl-D-mannosaminuronic acid dehydrogenase
MKVSVIGLGYVGLPTAAVLADAGHDVLGIDIDIDIVNTINQGNIHIVEPGLLSKVRSLVKKGNLRASVCHEISEIYIISVPTPLDVNNQPNISYIKAAVDELSQFLKKGDLVILESTSPIGTSEKIKDWMSSSRKDLKFPEFEQDIDSDIYIAHCPERVLPGNILHEIIFNDRIIGGISKESSIKTQSFYQSFTKGECFITNSRLAEFSKLAENAFRDVNIAFSNELSMISEKVGVNVWDLIKLANKHPRVNILRPGPGVGGHCIAVDPLFIADSAPDDAVLIKAARRVNNSKPKFILEKLRTLVDNENTPISELSISVFGLSYKADIDDLRESPSMDLAKQIAHMGFKKCTIIEPNLQTIPKTLDQSVLFNENIVTSLDSDILVFLVAHSEFLNFKKLEIDKKIIIDACGLLED